MGLGVAFMLVPGCGAPAEDGAEGDGTIPVFSGPNGSAGAASSPMGGSSGSSNTAPSCTPGTAGCAARPPEGNPANPPISQNPAAPVSAPIASACAANSVSCEGNTLSRCDAAGTSLTRQDCAANGGTCGPVAGVASCITPPVPSCTPGALTCDGANTISTCAADGSSATLSRCPDGTNCTGNGQCTPVRCNQAALLNHNGNGGVTVYWFAQGTIDVPRGEDQDVHCGFNGTRANNDDRNANNANNGANDRVEHIQDPALFGAMNLSEYNVAATCGACVELSQGGRNVTITVADSCDPGRDNNVTCTSGHIDLSRTAFQQLTGQSTGDINGVSWRVVPCSGVDNVQFLLKKPDDEYWNQFVVVNHRYPIAKAEVLMEDGRWLQARREAHNYWLPPEGDGGLGGDMGTYRVRVTDVNGAIIEEQLALRGGLQGGTGQFGCQ